MYLNIKRTLCECGIGVTMTRFEYVDNVRRVLHAWGRQFRGLEDEDEDEDDY